MKTVFLVDTFLPSEELEDIKKLLGKKEVIYANTYNCEKENEYRYLTWIINDFVCSKSTVLLVHFSGNEEVAKEIGDENSEMIIPIFTANHSTQTVTNPASIIKDMLNRLA